MRLFVARHGTAFEHDGDKRYLGVKEDPTLSSAGRRQSETLARALRRRGVRGGMIVAGPQRRQQETAAILAKKLGMARVASAPALSEIDYGPWEGLSKEEILAKWPEESRAWKKEGVWPAAIFGGSFEATRARLGDWLSHLKGVGEEMVVAVTSQGTLRALFALADPEGWKASCAAGRATEANVGNGHWCELEIGSGGTSVTRWNAAPSFVDRLPFLG